MKVSIVFLLAAASQAFFLDREVCYGDLGCFNTQDIRTLSRPIVLLPDEPNKIGTRFFLYTRLNPTKNEEQELTRKDVSTFSNSYFKASRPLKIIIHGFTHSAHEPWVQKMVAELLKNDDMNIIAIDWRNGAGLPYTQATANIRVVAMEMVKLIEVISSMNPDMKMDNIHMIGHSLGAHAASEVGTKILGIGRISGLDPAEPYFEGSVEQVRLEPRDAKFVDVIHSDGSAFLGSLGMGYRASIGHVDFYPNGGGDQPGCEAGAGSKLLSSAVSGVTSGVSGLTSTFACSHERAIYYYIESINNNCPFNSYPCASWDEFKKGNCLKCGEGANACSNMGYHATKTTGRGDRYLATNLKGSAPFCTYHYGVGITNGIMDKDGWGQIQVAFESSDGQTHGPFSMSEEDISMKSKEVQKRLVVTTEEMSDIGSTKVTYTKGTCLTCFLYSDFYRVQSVKVISGVKQSQFVFCGKNTSIAKDQIRTFTAEQMSGVC